MNKNKTNFTELKVDNATISDDKSIAESIKDFISTGTKLEKIH